MQNNILNVLKKEIREMFRDKKSLAMMLIIPILIPFIVLGMSALFEMQVNLDISEYNKIGFNYTLSETEQEIINTLEIDPTIATEEELKEKYNNEEINLYILKNDNNYTIYGNDNEITTLSSILAESYLNQYKEYLQGKYLETSQVDPNDVLNIITIQKEITASDTFFASYIINYAFLFIIMAITVSATYPATDTTAGEKERGTLETLLTFPIKSRDIIIGKFLSVSLSSIITGVLSLLLACLSLFAANHIFTIYEGMNLMLSPPAFIFSLLVIIAYSFLISGLCIAIASRAKTFKEAQSALTPITFISFFPGMIAFMTGITSNLVLSIVPFVNFTLIFTDISNGNFNYLQIFLLIISTIIYIALVLYVIIKNYKSEKVLFNA